MLSTLVSLIAAASSHRVRTRTLLVSPPPIDAKKCPPVSIVIAATDDSGVASSSASLTYTCGTPAGTSSTWAWR
jgi:hypothetical protein